MPREQERKYVFDSIESLKASEWYDADSETYRIYTVGIGDKTVYAYTTNPELAIGKSAVYLNAAKVEVAEKKPFDRSFISKERLQKTLAAMSPEDRAALLANINNGDTVTPAVVESKPEPVAPPVPTTHMGKKKLA